MDKQYKHYQTIISLFRPFTSINSNISGIQGILFLIIKEMIGQNQKNEQGSWKHSLCRFYLRGLCQLPSKECPFAHGMIDLLLTPFSEHEDEKIYRSYQEEHQINQKLNAWPLYSTINENKKNYINLYEFHLRHSDGPHHSLEQINQNKALKKNLRKQMHQEQFGLFLQRITSVYNPLALELNFLEREYYRVGFNKLMTRINFKHLIEYISERGYFKFESVMPPRKKQKLCFYCLSKDDHEIEKYYLRRLQQFFQAEPDIIKEQQIISQLMNSQRKWYEIPPFTMFLQNKKMALKDFMLKLEMGEKFEGSIYTEKDLVLKEMQMLIEETILLKGYCDLNKDVYQRSAKFYRNLMKTVLNNLGEEYSYIKSPHTGLEMIILARNCLSKSEYFFPQVKCDCDYSQGDFSIPPNEVQKFKFDGSTFKYFEHVCFYIETHQQLISITPHILQKMRESGMISVDLEGNLGPSSSAYISLIQICNPACQEVYIIDYYLLAKDLSLSLQKSNLAIRAIMCEKSTVKVFHDCRNDSLALHTLLTVDEKAKTGTCIVNVIDTSAIETGLRCLRKKQQPEKSPALNELLTKYQSLPNHLKEKFHGIWETKDSQDPNLIRPIDPQFMQYCVLDVIGLCKVWEEQRKQISLSLALLLSKNSLIVGYQCRNKEN